MEALLLSCQSPAQIEDILERSFTSFLQTSNISKPSKIIDPSQAELHRLISSVLSCDNSKLVSERLQSLVQNPKLRTLLEQILHEHRRQNWRSIATRSTGYPSLPTMVDLNWRVETTVTSSNHGLSSSSSNTNEEPVAVVDIATQGPQHHTECFPELRNFHFHMDQGTYIYI
jgi:hypothetical protein